MNKLSKATQSAITGFLIGAALNAHAATTDLANAPLITSPTSSVLPNVFLMLDDSGSMGWDYMPDRANDFGSNSYGAASSQCNGVFYDPNITYDPPVESTGTSYPDSSFTNAWNNGYNTGGGSTNLSTSFISAGGDSAQPAFYYVYSGTQTTERLKDYYNTSSTFYKECDSAVSSATISIGGSGGTSVTSVTVNGLTITSAATGSTTNTDTLASWIRDAINAHTTTAGYRASVWNNVVTIYAIKPADVGISPVVNKSGSMTFSASAFSNTTGAGKFTKVIVSATSGPGATDERTNFANWWSYYHTRMLMMKTATGRAFNSIDDTFRVGYASLNNNTGSDMLELATFNTTQKAAWYGKLYAASPNNSTPLREALAMVGRMYARDITTFNGVAIADPIQYSCQQNFTILTTDGFWNGNAGEKLDGTAVGNQDYFETRPMYDGADYARTIVTPYTTVERRETVTSGQVTTNTWGRRVVTMGAACSVSAPPADAVSSLSDNSKTIALGLSASNPNTSNPNRCYNLAANAWLCRSGGNPVSESSVTDSNGTTWYLVSSSSDLGSSCVRDRTAFDSGGSTNYSTKKGACPAAAGAGTYVVTTPSSRTETISGYETTRVDEYTATQTTTQTFINGVAGPVGPLTPATPAFVLTANISTTTTPADPAVWGPWTDGATTSVCTANTDLPAAGTIDDVPPYTTTTTGGTSVVTVLSSAGPTTGTPTETSSNSGGTSDTLADVAEYYYITDLRTVALGNCRGTTLCSASDPMNNVPSSGLDVAEHQHMTTFTLGLGARGRMVFDPLYESATSGDFYHVKKGSTADGSNCPWQSSGSGACNWPTPGSNLIENIDDLWHAAVNGRGTYFSAANPTGLATALSSALAGVSARTGSAAAATTSNAFVTQGDNFLFRSTFVSQEWTGELIRQQLDVSTGDVSPTVDWSAQGKLDADTSRNIYFFDSSSATNLSAFTLTNLTSASLDGFFKLPHITSLSQLCAVGSTCLAFWQPNTSYQAGKEYRNGTTWYHVNTGYTSGATFGATDTANASVVTGVEGLNLISFIKGDRTYEGVETDIDNGKYYRLRKHVLGDIVSSETTYVKGALSPEYGDLGYAAHKTAVADRQPMVYVGANDGMLHAFYADTGKMDGTTGKVVTSGGIDVLGGEEAWAFIPTEVIPNLYRLADKEYYKAANHRYFVDGSPVTADICISSCGNAATAVWKTILVSGLNGGGKSYFALDITNPAQPKALWEFTHANLGYTFGNPKVVKLKTGQWVVLLTSGYNNIGNGQGYLYVLDAYTGAMATTVNSSGIIGTGVGSVATPSGLGRLDAPLATPGVDATATAVYAGDMLGNLWRFDINGDLGASGYDAQLLATLLDGSGNIQPITTKPLLSLVDTTLIVMVGTGRYLGSSDLPDTSQQSFYAIKDTYPTGTTPSVAIFGNPRTEGTFVKQTQTTTTCPPGTPSEICTSGQSVVVSSNNTVSFSSNGGWYLDFLHAGERVNTDPDIIDATLVFNTNVPNASSCSVGGDSYQYQLNYSTGGSVSASPTGVVATKLGNELSTRPVVATLEDGTNKAYSQGSGGGDPNAKRIWSNLGSGSGSTASGPVTRKSWRELIQR